MNTISISRRVPLLVSLSLAAAAATAAPCPPGVRCFPPCQVSVQPASLSLAPGQSSPPVLLRVNCAGQTSLNFRTTVSPGLPGMPRVDPPLLAVTFPGGGTTGSATFRLLTTTATRPGLYTVDIGNDPLELYTSLTLRVEEPRGLAAVSPAVLTTPPGAGTAPLTLTLAATNLAGVALRFVPSLPPALAGKVTVVPSPVVLTVPAGGSGGSATFQLQVAPDAPGGTYVLALEEADLRWRASFTLNLEAPRVTATVTPAEVTVAPSQGSPPLTLRVETNLTGVTFTFEPRLPPSLAGRVTVVPSPVVVSVPAGGHTGSASFRLDVAPGAPPGRYTLALAEHRLASEAPFGLRIEASHASLAVFPERVAVAPGQTGPPLTLRVANTNLAGDPLTFEVELPPPLRGNTTLDPQRLTLTVPGGGGAATATFRVHCTLEAPPGSYTVALVERRYGLRAVFALDVPALAARIEVVPGALSLQPGQTSPPLTLRVTEPNFAGIPLDFEAELPPLLRGRVTLDPPRLRVVVPAGAPSATAFFRITCAGDTPPGVYTVALVEPGLGLRAGFTLEIEGLPEIGAVVPGSAAAGTSGVVVRLTGRGFRPGAVVSGNAPALRFGPTRVLSPELAETTVTVRAGAAAGPYRLDLTNPDGGRTRDGIGWQVVAADSLVAPPPSSSPAPAPCWRSTRPSTRWRSSPPPAPAAWPAPGGSTASPSNGSSSRSPPAVRWK